MSRLAFVLITLLFFSFQNLQFARAGGCPELDLEGTEASVTETLRLDFKNLNKRALSFRLNGVNKKIYFHSLPDQKTFLAYFMTESVSAGVSEGLQVMAKLYGKSDHSFRMQNQFGEGGRVVSGAVSVDPIISNRHFGANRYQGGSQNADFYVSGDRGPFYSEVSKALDSKSEFFVVLAPRMEGNELKAAEAFYRTLVYKMGLELP